jgi:enamine deaminase RidA (YjgF/YER057c/UK114 family)
MSTVETGDRQAIWPGDIPKPLAPYSPAIKAGGWLFVAGQLARDFETRGSLRSASSPIRTPATSSGSSPTSC